MLTDLFDRRPATTRALAAVVPVLLGLLFVALHGVVDNAAAALLFVLVIVGAALSGDRWTGFLASLFGALAFDFFCTEPYLSLKISSGADIQVAVVMLLVGLAITELALWAHRERAAASERGGYLDTLAQLGRGSAEDPVGAAAAEIQGILRVDSVRYAEGRPPADAAVVHRDGTVTRGKEPLDVGTVGLHNTAETVLPVHRGNAVIGHYTFVAASRGSWPTPQQLRVAALLADQVGARGA